MKKVRIYAYQAALVFKNGEYKKMLSPGTYWFWGNVDVMIYDVTVRFNAPVDLDILLQDKMLANALHVIRVSDNEIVLQYRDGSLKQVLTAG
ncbi:MAG TPA: slipin family protein, partial [Ferruginibacter sp.]|nr:slipin family protein [Ferruginibacter sp.]